MERKMFPKDSLISLLFRCGHKLHHSDKSTLDPQQLFQGLSAQEQEELKTLLTKLTASWKEEK